MDMAAMAATRSTCPRASVGCVLVQEKRIVACGYNGSMSGDVHCIGVGCTIREGHCVRTVHAEANAVAQCARFGISMQGATCYVTHRPCWGCFKLMMNAGIRLVLFKTHYGEAFPPFDVGTYGHLEQMIPC